MKEKKRCANIINKHHKLCEPSKVEKLNTKNEKKKQQIDVPYIPEPDFKTTTTILYQVDTRKEYILAKKHIRQYMYGTNNWGWKMYNQTKLE